MDWASDVENERPKFNQLYVKKDTITEYTLFEAFVRLHNIDIIAEEPEYYILEGSDKDLNEFKYYWNYNT